jgi:hypothetical protein
VVFSWADWSFYDSALTYALEYSTDPTFSTGVTRRSGITSHAQVETLPDGLYSWRARAFDHFGDSSALSEVRTIWVDNAVPAVPTPVPPSPMAGDTISDSTPTFFWTGVSGAKSTAGPTPVTYELQVATDPLFSTELRSYTALTATTFKLPLADKLPRNQSWHWHIQATDAAGNESGFSATERFYLRHLYTVGDFNGDQVLDVFDVIGLIDYVFSNGPAPAPPTVRVDMNCDGVYDVFDVVILIDVVFQGGSAQPCP